MKFISNFIFDLFFYCQNAGKDQGIHLPILGEQSKLQKFLVYFNKKK